MSELNSELMHILRHSLGLDINGKGKQYRNHYVAGGDQVKKCRELVSLGFMIERQGSEITGFDPLFQVTDSGKQIAPKPTDK